jgi:hypothetical protein
MDDVIFIVLTLVFFAATIGLMWLCERLMEAKA